MTIPEHRSFELVVNSYRKPGEIKVLFCGQGEPIGGHKIGPAVHHYVLMHTVVAGKGTFEIGGMRHECGAGDTFVIMPNELFSYEADAADPWSYVWVALEGVGAVSFLQSIGITRHRAVIKETPLSIVRYYEAIQSAFRSESPLLADIDSAGYARLLLAELGRSNADHIRREDEPMTETERRMDYAAELIRSQYSTALSVDWLAGQLGYHRTYFTQQFKRYTGQSPKQYLFRIRMEQAEYLLAHTSLSIEEVAGSTGYRDSLYFSRLFRERTGLAPTAFRKNMKADNGSD